MPVVLVGGALTFAAVGHAGQSIALVVSASGSLASFLASRAPA